MEKQLVIYRCDGAFGKYTQYVAVDVDKVEQEIAEAERLNTEIVDVEVRVLYESKFNQ